MEFRCIYYKLLSVNIFFKFMCLVIFNQNDFPSLLLWHLLSLMMCLLSLTGDPLIANHNNQFPMNKIRSCPTLFLVWKAISLWYVTIGKKMLS